MEYLNRLWPEWTCAGEIGRDAAGPIYKIRKPSGGGRMAQCAVQVISVPGRSVSSGTLKGAGLGDAAVRDFYAREAESILREASLWQSLQSEATIHKILEVRKLDLAQVQEAGGEVPGYRIYLRMELLRGADHYMDELFRRSETGSPDAWPVVCMGLDILSALIRLNRHGIIHGGIRPSAIYIDDKGICRLGGYDIARGMNPAGYGLTEASLYMAPELSETGESDATADCYALALVLYRYLNHKRLPFSPASGRALAAADVIEAQVRRMQGEKIPLPDGCDKTLGQILVRAASAEKEERFKGPEDFREALLTWAFNRGYLDLVPGKKEEIDPADASRLRVTSYARYGTRYQENRDLAGDYTRILEGIEADMGFYQPEEEPAGAGPVAEEGQKGAETSEPERPREEAAIYQIGEDAHRVPDQLYPKQPGTDRKPEKRIVVQVGGVRVSAPKPERTPVTDDIYNRKKQPRSESEEGIYTPPSRGKRRASGVADRVSADAAREARRGGTGEKKEGIGLSGIILILVLLLALAGIFLAVLAPQVLERVLEALSSPFRGILFGSLPGAGGA